MQKRIKSLVNLIVFLALSATLFTAFQNCAQSKPNSQGNSSGGENSPAAKCAGVTGPCKLHPATAITFSTQAPATTECPWRCEAVVAGYILKANNATMPNQTFTICIKNGNSSTSAYVSGGCVRARTDANGQLHIFSGYDANNNPVYIPNDRMQYCNAHSVLDMAFYMGDKITDYPPNPSGPVTIPDAPLLEKKGNLACSQ